MFDTLVSISKKKMANGMFGMDGIVKREVEEMSYLFVMKRDCRDFYVITLFYFLASQSFNH